VLSSVATAVGSGVSSGVASVAAHASTIPTRLRNPAVWDRIAATSSRTRALAGDAVSRVWSTLQPMVSGVTNPHHPGIAVLPRPIGSWDVRRQGHWPHVTAPSRQWPQVLWPVGSSPAGASSGLISALDAFLLRQAPLRGGAGATQASSGAATHTVGAAAVVAAPAAGALPGALARVPAPSASKGSASARAGLSGVPAAVMADLEDYEHTSLPSPTPLDAVVGVTESPAASATAISSSVFAVINAAGEESSDAAAAPPGEAGLVVLDLPSDAGSAVDAEDADALDAAVAEMMGGEEDDAVQAMLLGRLAASPASAAGSAATPDGRQDTLMALSALLERVHKEAEDVPAQAAAPDTASSASSADAQPLRERTGSGAARSSHAGVSDAASIGSSSQVAPSAPAADTETSAPRSDASMGSSKAERSPVADAPGAPFPVADDRSVSPYMVTGAARRHASGASAGATAGGAAGASRTVSPTASDNSSTQEVDSVARVGAAADVAGGGYVSAADSHSCNYSVRSGSPPSPRSRAGSMATHASSFRDDRRYSGYSTTGSVGGGAAADDVGAEGSGVVVSGSGAGRRAGFARDVLLHASLSPTSSAAALGLTGRPAAGRASPAERESNTAAATLAASEMPLAVDLTRGSGLADACGNESAAEDCDSGASVASSVAGHPTAGAGASPAPSAVSGVSGASDKGARSTGNSSSPAPAAAAPGAGKGGSKKKGKGKR
jgi:hypothetical protein